MSNSNLTLLGVERYLNRHDDSLFKNIELPYILDSEGKEIEIDKDVLVNSILLSANEFEVLYSDPYFLKESTSLFFKKYKPTFTRWLESSAATWNPIENYDRYEDISDNSTLNRVETKDNISDSTMNDSHSENASGSITTTDDTTTIVDGTVVLDQDETNSSSLTKGTADTTSRAAFNSTSFENYEKVQGSGSDSTTGGGTIDSTTDTDSTTTIDNDVHSVNSSNTSGNINQAGHSTSNDRINGTDTTINSHTAHIHGNIGVTTATAMLKEYNEFYRNNNVIQQISDLYITEFCLMVY